VANCEANNYSTKETAFRSFSISGADDDDSEEEGSVQYIASHYNEKAGRGRRNSLETILPSPRGRKNQFSFLKLSPSSSSSLSGLKVGLSESFDTQETHLEEASASETSISTMTSCEDDSSRLSSAKKKVRWLDETEQQDLAVVHSVKCDSPVTCRVVILLLMNNGTEATDNFEFLHCEFRLDRRLKVSDALSQITELVLGTREHPRGVNASRSNVEKKAAKRASSSFRPFTTLYYQGRELINVCSLQDFPLQDGQSILVALRKGPQDRDLLLKQSAMLLSDRRLNKEIRKARISGRSLQVLLSSQDIREKRERPATPVESEKGNNNDDLESCDDASEADVPLNSTFWDLSLDAIEDVDFGESTFDTMDEEHSNWFDEAFFKGTDLFLHVDKKSGVTNV